MQEQPNNCAAAQTPDPWAVYEQILTDWREGRCVSAAAVWAIRAQVEMARAIDATRHAEEVAALRAELDGVKASCMLAIEQAERDRDALTRLTTPPASQEP